jgi:SAM-dependent methyltransferase
MGANGTQGNGAARAPLEEVVVGGYRFMTALASWYISLWDQVAVSRVPFEAVPPIHLRHRVQPGGSLDTFLRAGQQSRLDVEAALERVDRRIEEFSDVLDFGCGCGRTFIWFEDLAYGARLCGTDVDAEALGWCRDNLQFGTFAVNGELPPLDYPDGAFDLVVGLSVLTQLSEAHQGPWLGELRRVTRPGGIVLLTVNGPDRARHDLTPGMRAMVAERGVLHTTSLLQRGIFPERGPTTYHTMEYVMETFSRCFDVRAYLPLGLNGAQDVVVLERRPG